ncbi:putative Ig domain-containing protein [Streptomyces sp. NBC_00083]|uniref:putative Ig domain-containing protein n=1 Tax=Streptomyces sp. NBC_00083 TaxID=2975647 RepID=UPI002250A075|nr:putative Ig domain-containing protein [Streptomyces sp. NBC_00083]MCX5384473.1 putative Ig domain-containing protein [Streptomyces sp. NBC_00083]
MRSPTCRRAVTAAVAAVTFAGLAALPAHASAPPVPGPAPSVPADVRTAMARDLGLTAEGVRLRTAAERGAGRSATTLRATLGDRLAGLWFDAADGRLHADVTAAADIGAVARAGAVPRLVRHSGAQLDAATRQITAWGGAGLLSWGPDTRTNQVDVVLDPARSDATTSAVRGRLASLGDLVKVSESYDAPRQQGGAVVGGESWVPGTESPCSIGFPVARSGGAKAFLTAGHCTNDVDQPAYGKDGSRMGTSNKNGTGSVDSADGDFGIVDVDQAGWDLSSKVSGWGKGDVNLTGSEDAVVGTAVCHSGRTTGFQCGEVTKVDQTVDYGNVVINGLSYTSACSAGGDSGGSYVTATGGKAVGLHSGGGSATCSSGSGEKFTIFQPVNEALATFGATLATASPQPGEVTVAAVSSRSTPAGSAVELKNSAEGGTAPYTWSAAGLPPGLAVVAATGTVSGTPAKAGSYAVTVTATDSAGRSGSAGFTWTVTTPGTGGPTLTDPGSQSVYVGRPVSVALHAAGGTGPYTFTATNLPAGLTVGAATGVISGTPTAWGSRSAALTVTDAAGKKASVTVTFTVWF